MHARAYHNIGFELGGLLQQDGSARARFCAEMECWSLWPRLDDLCRYPGLDYVDVCSFPDSHLEPVKLCAEIKRPDHAAEADCHESGRSAADGRSGARGRQQTGVMSQHRFDDSTLFLKRAIGSWTPGQDSTSRCLREMVSQRRILFASHQRQLANRRRRRAHQPSHSSSGCSACT